MTFASHIARERAAPLTQEDKKVLAATLVGTAIEWYDYFVYAQAASLVFAPFFFTPFVQRSPGLALILSFATVGVAFLFRPLGAIVCGHLGDRFGRKVVLAMTLVLMGSATTLIGVLPTHAQIGIWAPIILVLLRVLQGFSAGGEWGGAALLAVERASPDRRGLFGAFPQLGVPIGMIVATGVLWSVTMILGKERFLEWGWRVPFLLSIVLVAIGGSIRRSVEESPVFQRMHKRQRESAAPLGQLFRYHTKQVITTALTFVGNNAAGYLFVGYFIGYGQRVLHLPTDKLLLSCTAAACVWLVSTLVGGALADRIGRVRTFQVGYIALALWAIPMWLLVDSRDITLFFIAVAVLAIPLGLTYGPQAALYAEMFPTKVRYSGVSVGYALGSILGGAFAATIAQWIISATGHSWLVGLYIVAMSIISFVAVSLVKERVGVDLNAEEVSEGSGCGGEWDAVARLKSPVGYPV
jgi:metabolite-proton symporter